MVEAAYELKNKVVELEQALELATAKYNQKTSEMSKLMQKVVECTEEASKRQHTEAVKLLGQLRVVSDFFDDVTSKELGEALVNSGIEYFSVGGYKFFALKIIS